MAADCNVARACGEGLVCFPEHGQATWMRAELSVGGVEIGARLSVAPGKLVSRKFHAIWYGGNFNYNLYSEKSKFHFHFTEARSHSFMNCAY